MRDLKFKQLNGESELQNIWHVQRTDAQINGNIIDNINPKHKTDQKHQLKTHTKETKTQSHF